MIDPTKGWEEYMYIRDNGKTHPTPKEIATKLLEMKKDVKVRNDCPEWEALSSEILEDMSEGEPMETQREKIKRVIAHTRTCHHESCVRARKFLPEKFFNNVADEDME